MISNWKKTLTHLEWDITVPCNTTALVYLPTLDEKAVKDKDVTFVRREGNSTVWSVPSGNYHFSVSMDLLQVKTVQVSWKISSYTNKLLFPNATALLLWN